jgi:hypothetical protein
MPEKDGLTQKQIDKLLAAARAKPELVALEWNVLGGEPGEAAAVEEKRSQQPRTLKDLVESDPKTYDAHRTKIRDRYIAVRFEGVARSGADLEDAPRVIKASRLAFEEGHPERALELLELAIEQKPFEISLWLAELEMSFLLRDAGRFVDSARAFRAAHPAAGQWAEIERLGRALAPDEPLFGARQGPRAHEHYGPWPHLPNWIQAPWDLTAEVSAADFRRAMLGEGGDGR